MSNSSAGDEDVAAPRDGDGQAALLLVESLIHALIARAALTLAEALEIVQVAIDAQIAIGDERGGHDGAEPPPSPPLAAILTSLANGR